MQLKKLILYLCTIAFLIALSSFASAGILWDDCSDPHHSFSRYSYGTDWLGCILGVCDTEDWADVYLPKGTYTAYLSGPYGTNFNLYVYSSCNGAYGSNLACSSTYSGSAESCTFSSSGKTYHLRARRSSGDGTWYMWVDQVYVACYSNSDCGSSGYTGSMYCSSGDIYRDYKTYTCNNPGTGSAYCTSSTSQIKQSECGNSEYTGSNYCYDSDVYKDYTERGCKYVSGNPQCYSSSSGVKQDECGDTSYGSWSTAYCSGNQVKQKRTIYNKGCSSGDCTSSTTTETRTTQTCSSNEYCSEGQCKPSCTDHEYTACYDGDIYWYDSCWNRQDRKSDCGEPTYGAWGNSYCSENSVMQTRNKYTPYCENSDCRSRTETETKVATTCDGLFNFCLIDSCIACEPHQSYQCAENDVYWFNACGGKEDMKQECGTSGCEDWGGNYCKDGKVVRSRTCYDRGCSQNACYKTTSETQDETVKTCNYGCSNGECLELPDLSVSPEDIIFEKT